MAFNFIFMLTADDRTVADAGTRLEEVLAGGARHIGFKDVGLPKAELKGLADRIRAAGGRSYLEVVSLDADSELASARAAVELDVRLLARRDPGDRSGADYSRPSDPLLSVCRSDHRASQRSLRPGRRHRRRRAPADGARERAWP